MTWNIYVGAYVDTILGVQDPQQIPVVVDWVYQQMLSTDIYERVHTIAKQIRKHRPQLIGLQEVSLIQRFAIDPGGNVDSRLCAQQSR